MPRLDETAAGAEDVVPEPVDAPAHDDPAVSAEDLAKD